MPIYARKGAILLVALALSGQAAQAQVAPVQYWLPGGLFGFGGGSSDGGGADSYRNFPSFAAGAGDWRDKFPTGMFVRSEAGGVGWNGLGQAASFGNFGALSYQGALAGYNFKGVAGVPVSVYAGFDTLNYNPGFGGPLAPFSTDAGTAVGTIARAGIAFQPAPNVSLSFDAGFAQQSSGAVDSDIRSPLLPGQTPIFIGGRR